MQIPTSRVQFVILSMVCLTACGSVQHYPNKSVVHEDSVSAPETLKAAPWALSISRDVIAPVFLSEWNQAKNRSNCALLALSNRSEAHMLGAKPRRANFAGGWAVAYDMPNLRSAYGIAGTGTLANSNNTYTWPHYKQWSDGSRMGYGLEGGEGPDYLAYLSVKGQSCLYNVWSRLGEEHLLRIINNLRRVD